MWSDLNSYCCVETKLTPTRFNTFQFHIYKDLVISIYVFMYLLLQLWCSVQQFPFHKKIRCSFNSPATRRCATDKGFSVSGFCFLSLQLSVIIKPIISRPLNRTVLFFFQVGTQLQSTPAAEVRYTVVNFTMCIYF